MALGTLFRFSGLVAEEKIYSCEQSKILATEGKSAPVSVAVIERWRTLRWVLSQFTRRNGDPAACCRPTAARREIRPAMIQLPLHSCAACE